jgi:hypothetical protein
MKIHTRQLAEHTPESIAAVFHVAGYEPAPYLLYKLNTLTNEGRMAGEVYDKAPPKTKNALGHLIDNLRAEIAAVEVIAEKLKIDLTKISPPTSTFSYISKTEMKRMYRSLCGKTKE